MTRQRWRGDEPHLAAPATGALAARALAEGFPVHPVPMRGTWDVPSMLTLASLHRRLEPDVVHWHAARAHAIGAGAARLRPGPARVLSRRVDFLVRRSPGSRILYAQPLDAIIAISEGVKEALVRSGIHPAAIRVVPSGIDLAPFDAPFDREAARQRLGIGPATMLVLQVAALAPHKSQTDLLRAAAELADRPEIQFWVAGDGSLRAALEEERARLGLEARVRFLGFREDVTDLLRAADLFCVSSYLEGLGTSTLDAMAAGLAVVATRVGGIPEAVQEGVTGLLVEPRRPDELARAIRELTLDPARRAAMGAAGRTRARDFGYERTEERTRAVYLEAMGRRRLTQ